MRGLGAGRRDPVRIWLLRLPAWPDWLRIELTLVLGGSVTLGRVGWLCFLDASGVALADDGVLLFAAGTAGTGEGGAGVREGLLNSGWGVVGVPGAGGTAGICDSLFRRRASVGLIVLAPRPPT